MQGNAADEHLEIVETRKPLPIGGCSKLSVCYENLYYHIYLVSWTYRHRK